MKTPMTKLMLAVKQWFGGSLSTITAMAVKLPKSKFIPLLILDFICVLGYASSTTYLTLSEGDTRSLYTNDGGKALISAAWSSSDSSSVKILSQSISNCRIEVVAHTMTSPIVIHCEYAYMYQLEGRWNYTGRGYTDYYITVLESSSSGGGSSSGGSSGGSSQAVQYNISNGTLTSVTLNGADSVVIPSTVNKIGDYAFDGQSTLRKIIIPESVTSIGYYAFRGCKKLRSLSLSKNVKFIGYGAFINCSSLSEMVIDNANQWYEVRNGLLCSIEKRSIVSCLGGFVGDLVIPNDIISVAEYAFFGCSDITGVTIPEGLEIITQNAFRECTSLQDVKIAGSVVCIGSCAFLGCTNLDSLTIASGDKKILSYSFQGCTSLKKVILPEGVTEIGQEAFKNCTMLSTVIIPNTVERIGYNAFDGCNASLYDTATIIGVKLIDGWAIGFVNASIPGNLELSGIKGIGDYAFYGCTKISSVSISHGIKRIGDSAFRKNSNLKSIAIPDSVETLYGQVFEGCHNLSSANLPDNIRNIGYGLFSECANLTNIVLSASLTNIEQNAFYNCKGLKKVVLPFGLRSIGANAFSGCSGMTEVVLPDSLLSIPYRVFYNCNSLTSVNLPNSLTIINNAAFEGCNKLGSIVIPSSVTELGGYAFRYCNALTNLIFVGDAPLLSSSSFTGISSKCILRIPIGANGYEVDSNGKCKGMIVQYYGVSSNKADISSSNGGYILVAKEGELIEPKDILVTTILHGSEIDITSAYSIDISANGKLATATLKKPMLEKVGTIDDVVEDDPTGILIAASKVELATTPPVIGDETLCALPVVTTPGLYYQASWGDDLNNMTTGAKVQATGDSLYIGVIKQTGDKGFYKLSVSDR